MLKIITYPDPMLRNKSVEVLTFDSEIKTLLDEMQKVMYINKGIGLAAPQIGENIRVFIIDIWWKYKEDINNRNDNINNNIDDNITDNMNNNIKDVDKSNNCEGRGNLPSVIDLNKVENKKVIEFINPVITKKEGSIIFRESCLSVIDFSSDVERFETLEITAFDRVGNSFSMDAQDLLSIAIQHEYDHLEGKLFIDHLSPLKRTIIKRLKESKRDKEESEDNNDLRTEGV